ncbi:hypothetical protein KK141_09250 [Dyella sp. LX-66]|uniref:rolling circle replication-associated protein n=1 Tax=unclassified Dyella TaxID=2634549 RepID=UPI001BDFB416|nr:MULTISPECIES: hypothetical protein [unclassified Dyella]MBT2117205.1 hypothetical protein [Dyella sp. LX-1]MBT2139719.1 hypothetical protein [Dyella sp. LX-66]
MFDSALDGKRDLYALMGEGRGAARGSSALDLPPPRMTWKTRSYASPAMQALRAIGARQVREYADQLNAMDAPFQQMARERFFKGQDTGRGCGVDLASAASEGRAAGAPTELDPYKTKGPRPREVLEIDVYSTRIRRLQKAVRNSAHILDSAAHCDEQNVRWRRLFVTLTYARVEDWKPGHIGDFTRLVRKWFKRHCGGTRMRMVWVLELQKRGAVHYHCMIWVRARDYFPNPHKRGWWPHGFAHVLSSKVTINRPVSYMAKYASKASVQQAMSVPKGARMYGVCGPTEEGKRVIRWWRAPVFVRDALGGAADIRKVLGGYMDKQTGEFVRSEWKVTITPSGRVFAWREMPPLTETVQ